MRQYEPFEDSSQDSGSFIESGKLKTTIIIAVIILFTVWIAFVLTVNKCAKHDEQVPSDETARLSAGSGTDLIIGENSADTDAAPEAAINENKNYSWLVEPAVEADDILPIVRFRPEVLPSGEEMPFSEDTVIYDDIAAIVQNEKFGVISYSGLVISDSMFNEVSVGYDNRYYLSTDSYDPYTLTDKHELKIIDDPTSITGTDLDPMLFYLPDDYAYDYPIGGIPDTFVILWGSDGYFTELKEYNDIVAAPVFTKEDESRGFVVGKNGYRLDDVIYEDAGNFVDGILPVKKDGKWGYLDSDGNEVLPFAYDDCWDSNGTINISEDGEHYYNYAAFDASDGYIVVCKNKEFAIYDTAGSLVIDFGEFQQIRPVYEGMCWVKKDGKWGVIAIEPGAHINIVSPQERFPEKTARANSSSGLRMREGPGTNYKVIGMVSNNAEVTVCSYDGDWSYIRYRSAYGWVRSKYLS